MKTAAALRINQDRIYRVRIDLPLPPVATPAADPVWRPVALQHESLNTARSRLFADFRFERDTVRVLDFDHRPADRVALEGARLFELRLGLRHARGVGEDVEVPANAEASIPETARIPMRIRALRRTCVAMADPFLPAVIGIRPTGWVGLR